jgi:hypothetical protein
MEVTPTLAYSIVAMKTQTRRIKLGRYGLLENPIGLQVALPFKGRTLLGDVVSVEIDEHRGMTFLQVRHFNGEMWPINPAIGAVEVLR